MTEDVIQRMLASLICAGFAWSAGLIFQWARSRSSDLKALRKYERLRAKVEVLSRLTSIQLQGEPDATLSQRQHTLVHNELRSVFEELEAEDGAEDNSPLRIWDLFGSLRLGPSFSVRQVTPLGTGR